jgi:hypothetical protein
MRPNTEVNHKQAELLSRLFEQVQERFPSLERQEISRSPEDSEHIFLYVHAPLSEDEEVDFINFTGDLEADIFQETGYRLSLMPRFSPIMEHVL